MLRASIPLQLHINQTQRKEGSATESTCRRKNIKHKKIKCENYIFSDIAVETTGTWSKEA